MIRILFEVPFSDNFRRNQLRSILMATGAEIFAKVMTIAEAFGKTCKNQNIKKLYNHKITEANSKVT